MSNLRLALRMLFKTPVVTSVAVVSLALGIGSNAAIFSLFSQVLLRPLPVVEPERLVNLEAPGPKPGSDNCNQAGTCQEVFSYPMYRDLQRDQTVFTDIAAHRSFGMNVAFRNRTISGQGMQVSGSYFPTLGLMPALGRLLGPEVGEPVGGHPVAVLSHEFWVSHLGGDPDVVDQTITINGQSLTIVGVAPAGFRGTTMGTRPMAFVPISHRGLLSRGFDEFEDRRAYWVYLFARLKPGVALEQARATLEPHYQNILKELESPLQVEMSEATRARFETKPLPMRDGRLGQSRMSEEAGAPLLLLFGVTGVIVLIACANVANLLLARSAARAQEMAVRLSIGASRRQLVGQLLTESCLLALLGGAAGLVVAQWTLGFIASMQPPEDSGVLHLELDLTVVGFALVLSLATGILFGIVPALQSTRSDLVSTLKAQSGQPSGARSAARFRNGLVTAQVALSMALLAAAGLFTKSLANVSRVDLGVETENVVSFRLSPVLNGYETEQSRALFERMEEELRAQPGVTGVSAASVAVFAGNSWGNSVMVEGFEAGPDTDRNSRFNRVGVGYFRALGIPLLAGRSFAASDGPEAPPVAIVNETFARKFGLGDEAVGRWMGRGGLDAELDIEIVGLVKDARYDNVKNPEQPLFYIPYRQASAGSLTFYAKSALPPQGLMRSIPDLVGRLDPNLPVDDLKTLPQQVRESVVLDRMITLLSAGFAIVATLLAAVGLYGVLAYTVSQRTREIGLRMALGADRAKLRNMVMVHMGRMVLIGGAIGLAGAIGLGRLAQSLLYEMEGLQPGVLLAAGVGLAVIALAAGYLPARRASRVDPMTALRYE